MRAKLSEKYKDEEKNLNKLIKISDNDTKNQNIILGMKDEIKNILL